MAEPVQVFFNEVQLDFKPPYEWAFGEKIAHPETTARAESILAALQLAPQDFEIREPDELSLSALRRVHDDRLIALYHTAQSLPEGVTLYPSVFPKERQSVGVPTNLKHAGCFCFDSGTPLDAETWTAALWSASSAAAAVKAIKNGAPMAYSLSRPPGHHATRDLFGGYCYFNNAAVAAKTLRGKGRIAIVDIDYHHGNGTQSIFYRDPNVLVISVHADPVDAYPLFSGFAIETGAGRGVGFNVNIPIGRGCDGQGYLKTVEENVLPRLESYGPSHIILSAGLDTYERDPVGDFTLTTDDFFDVGAVFGRLGLPVAVIQEGGYYTPHLGRNARTLLYGVREGLRMSRASYRPEENVLPEPHRIVRDHDFRKKAARVRSPWHRTGTPGQKEPADVPSASPSRPRRPPRA